MHIFLPPTARGTDRIKDFKVVFVSYQRQEFHSFQKQPDWFRGPPSLLFNGYCGYCLVGKLAVVDSSWNVMAHGDAREGKWRGNWRMECLASTLHITSERGISSITTADAHNSAAGLDWTDAPADLNGIVRFAERWNLVSARVNTDTVLDIVTVSSIRCTGLPLLL